MSPLAILPVLSALKWPLTIAGAVLVFGITSEGTLSLVADNAHRITKPIEAAPDFNLPPVKQIGEIRFMSNEPSRMTEPVQVASIAREPVKSGSPSGVWANWKPSGAEAARPSNPLVNAQTVAYVGPKTVNIRAGASKSSAKLGVLTPGTKVGVAGTSGGWVNVVFESGEGWVYSTYLTDSFDSAARVASVTIRGGSNELEQPPREDALPRKGKLVEAGSRIAVRDVPGGDTVYRLEKGERVKIVERQGGWSRIITATGESGWIRAR